MHVCKCTLHGTIQYYLHASVFLQALGLEEMMEQVSWRSFHHVKRFLISLVDSRDSNLICAGSLHLLLVDRGGLQSRSGQRKGGRPETVLKIVL